MQFPAAIYTSDKNGNDVTGDGSEAKPFKTILKAMHFAGKEPFPPIYVDGKDEGIKYQLVAKSQLKKVQKIWVRECYKEQDKAKKEADDKERRTENLEKAKEVVIEEDKSLPEAQRIKIHEGDSRVTLNFLGAQSCLHWVFPGIPNGLSQNNHNLITNFGFSKPINYI